MTHWADVEAAKLLEARPGHQVFATAITPSGPIHVGNMREVLTTEAIFRACKDQGGDAELFYMADDYDPLRKVYPFLHESYEPYVGLPLKEIPAPDEKGRPEGDGTYADHFLRPFLEDLHDLGIEPTVYSAYDLYRQGKYVDATKIFFERQDEVRETIETISKRQLPKNWIPFNVQATESRRIGGVRVTGVEETMVSYEDPIAGETGVVDALEPGTGKLPWRLDWPARWQFLGVTFEAFGKDHGASGGSWDTGIPLVRDLLGGQEPHHVMYEFLNLKGKGAMHSSSGLAVSAHDVLQMTPPEVLRYLLMRQSPRKHIDFDPGLGILNLVDEFDRFERVYYGHEENPGTFSEVERTYELSCPRGPTEAAPMPINYRHLVTLSQIASDADGVEAILRRSGELEGDLTVEDKERLATRVDHVGHWLQGYAPDNVRFQVQSSLPASFSPSAEDREYLRMLLEELPKVEWTGKDIHDAAYEALTKQGRKPGEAFATIYQAILGQGRGPRAGFFLASMDRDWVMQRFEEAAAA